ncbi:MAG TPA: helicase-associated domain-containing protein [Rhodoglobus sp.]|nr:helicase-associated domain-containing protein [Rhodoglobus sp.]
MPASNDSALVLAGQLRTLSDAALAELLTAREIRGTGIRDFFDLADALLDPAAIQHALGRLDRSTLATLAALGELGPVTEADAAAHLTTLGADATLLPERLATAARLALLTQHLGRWVVPASVAEQLQLWPSLGLPSLHELVSLSAPAALSPVSGVDVKFTDHVASENAFQTTTSIAELIATLDLESARELARGGIALPDSKRLAAAMGVDLDRVSGLLDIASRAGLVALDSGRWMPAEASRTWMVDSSGERWALLATAWLERLPVDIRTILRERAHAVWGERLEEYVAWLFPAGDDWMRDRVRVYTRDAELLGITADNVPSTPGAALLASGADAAATAMAALFPPEVAQVYLQHDLSIVSPGPLAPPIDARLRTMADVEGRALASTYRVSTASLSRAMAAGETESSIREFLGGIALTGIPQPLDYLLTEAASRYGLVRVGATPEGRTYVSSTDGTLLRTLVVDHSIGSLGLVRSGDRLESRYDRDLVFWALSEARYPVAAENAAGEIVTLARRQASRITAAAATDTTGALIERLRVGSSADPDVTGKAWLARQLDVAIKGKVGLTVTVRMPDGSDVDYQLEPASVGGGRLRARDRRSDIERTLPLTSIVAVAPAE